MLETPADILSHFADADAVDGFIKWRKITKKPLTERAAALIGKTLREINSQGGDAAEALDLAQEHGWQTIKVDWYWKIKNGGHNGQRTNNGTQANTNTAGDDRFDAARRDALRIAGIS